MIKLAFTNANVVRKNNVTIYKLSCKLTKDGELVYLPGALCAKKWKNLGRGVDFNVVGISKCHPGDKFDETIGRRLAESKAKEKAYKKAKLILKDYLEHWNKKLITPAKDGKEFLDNLYKKEVEHTKKLLNEIS